MGAQWLSGKVLDSRPKGRGFEPQQHHCIVVYEQDSFILAYSTGSVILLPARPASRTHVFSKGRTV